MPAAGVGVISNLFARTRFFLVRFDGAIIGITQPAARLVTRYQQFRDILSVQFEKFSSMFSTLVPSLLIIPTLDYNLPCFLCEFL
jgi:hypothetical protein